MKFVHITDTHILKKFRKEDFGPYYEEFQDPKSNLIKALEEINWDGVDFLINTGDLAHDGGLEDYKCLKEIYEDYVDPEIKIFNILGNHDKKEIFKKVFREDLNYYTDLKGYRLLFLNLYEKTEELNGSIDQLHLNLLEDALKNCPSNGLLIFCHPPLVWNGPHQLVAKNSKDFLERLNGENIRGIFTGHSHEAAMVDCRYFSQYSGMPLFFSMRLASNNSYIINNSVGYGLVDISENMLQYNMLALDREPITQFDFSGDFK